jgi:hypothetical protein
MNRIIHKKLSTDLDLPNKYKFVLIKRPDGMITLSRSTYLSRDMLNKLNTEKGNVNIQQKDNSKIDQIILDVDYTQSILANKDKKKQLLSKSKQSVRTMNLTKKFLL